MLARTTIISTGLIIALTSLTGCAKDKSLAPPTDNEYVTVTIKVPPDFEAETIQVMYRSAVCKRRRSDSAGRPYEIEGFNSMEIQPRRLGTTDVYEAKLTVNGGGQCQWGLSNVYFGVTYSKPEQFGAGTFSGGGGVVIIFDHNNSSRGGADFSVDGDLRISKSYYPWIDEERLLGHWKSLRLFGGHHADLTYRALTAKRVHFEPEFHLQYPLRSVSPKNKERR